MKQVYGPRERLLHEPLSRLSTTELVMILIGSGTRHTRLSVTARRVAMQLMRYAPVTIDRLRSIDGVGEASASRLLAALALAARVRHHMPLNEHWETLQPAKVPYYVKLMLFDVQRDEIGAQVYQDASLDRLVAAVERGIRHQFHPKGDV